MALKRSRSMQYKHCVVRQESVNRVHERKYLATGVVVLLGRLPVRIVYDSSLERNGLLHQWLDDAAINSVDGGESSSRQSEIDRSLPKGFCEAGLHVLVGRFSQICDTNCQTRSNTETMEGIYLGVVQKS